MKSFSLWLALVGGISSFFSPCFLPLIPAYLSFISGIVVLDRAEVSRLRIRLLLRTLLFIGGFSVIFILLGLSAGALGRLLLANRGILMKISGVIIFLFGLHLIGLFKFLNFSFFKGFDLAKFRGIEGGSFVLGMAFSVGFIPCVGPILGSVLVLASIAGSSLRGAFLLAVYSVGLGIPLLLVALGISFISPYLKRLNQVAGLVQIISGALLIIFGILLFSGLFADLASLLF